MEEIDEAANKLFKGLAWQKAGKEIQENAKAFVKKYLKKDDPNAEMDFIWESLPKNKQKEIIDEANAAAAKQRSTTAPLDSLIQSGYNVKEFLEHGEDQRKSFFNFVEPISGCKYNIGQAKGFIIKQWVQQLRMGKRTLENFYQILKNIHIMS